MTRGGVGNEGKSSRKKLSRDCQRPSPGPAVRVRHFVPVRQLERRVAMMMMMSIAL